jgi:hypothetical protein
MPYKEIVTARIVSRQNHQPVSGATVRVYDKDLVLDDFLGEATTDAEGRFSVTFSSDDFQGHVSGFESRPDVFVKVTNPATGKTTKSKVFEELTGDLTRNDAEEILNLGDVEVD